VVSSRAVLVLVLVSIVTAQAYSQGSGSDVDDDEGAGDGSGSALVAPTDPKQRGKWLQDKLQATINTRPLLASSAKIGVSVVDVTTGTELFAREADKGMNLASNAKLLTAVAALGTLGGGFRWRTAVFIDDKALDQLTGVVTGDLYIRGRGDPTLTSNDLRALATEIAARGVRTIKGGLVIEATYFDTDVEPPHFNEQPKERAHFRAPVASFGVSRSAFIVNVIADPAGKARVWLEPDAGDHIKLTKVDVNSVVEGRTRIKVDIKPKKDPITKKDVLEVEVVGNIRFADGHWWSRRRVDDPVRYAGDVLKRALAEKGIKLLARNPIKTGTVPLNAKLLVAHDSNSLSSVVRDMNKSSDNYYAESVLKTLGAETRATPAPASWSDGIAAMQAYLAKLGLPPGTYRSNNGSGLFSATEVSARQLVTVLRGAHKDYRIGPDLLASLPVGGMDGTLSKRWHGSATRGRVRAKTGSLAAVTTLAGYVGVDSARPLAFAILVNDIPTGQKGPARAMADDMLDAIVAYLEAEASR
jgi:D-alanyl-D-alanine carboxypeptidase/D-alanyl-D-alanine-endopeptidase (penicillin-binding protein 4)